MPFAPYFDTGTWAGAQQYYRAGHVLSVTAERHALLAKGRNDRGEAYRQTIGIEAPKALHRLGKVHRICTCPMHSNCKHVGAALLASAGGPEPKTAQQQI